MAEITEQNLTDGSRNLADLGKIVNGPATGAASTVSTLTGGNIKTVARTLEELSVKRLDTATTLPSGTQGDVLLYNDGTNLRPVYHDGTGWKYFADNSAAT